ncbi:hypothetical protein [Altererythrobacter sp. ZODW24]|uniref:hypothetical protein n=1 Tax=Altererythrobacter sp. ZODW24 TaxID=2185142 RepID=UPI000DF80D72|nr:hypothetical protein [Altererythrobacter sp. ZODW24]
MSETSFDTACDNLSGLVDAVQFERLRWDRNEGPLLTKLVTWARDAFEEHGEFELTEEGSVTDRKRFVLKVHTKRTIGIAFEVVDGLAVIEPDLADRSIYTLTTREAITAPMHEFHEEWVKAALQEIFSRVQPLDSAA